MPTDYSAVIDTIRTWSQAYPLDVFPEPDFDSIDPAIRTSLSASMGRHVIGRLMELVEEAEKPEPF